MIGRRWLVRCTDPTSIHGWRAARCHRKYLSSHFTPVKTFDRHTGFYTCQCINYILFYYTFIYLVIYIFIYLSIHLFIYLFIFINLVFIFICLFIYLLFIYFILYIDVFNLFFYLMYLHVCIRSFIYRFIFFIFYFLKIISIYSPPVLHVKAKKNKSYVSKLPRAFVFRCAFGSAKSKVWNFFACLIFFQFFYELSCQNIQEKIRQTQWNTLNNRFLQLCVLSCVLLIQKSSSIF